MQNIQNTNLSLSKFLDFPQQDVGDEEKSLVKDFLQLMRNLMCLGLWCVRCCIGHDVTESFCKGIPVCLLKAILRVIRGPR